MITPKTITNTYPHAWSLDLVRNPSGRAFYFVTRFVSATELEYINDILGKPQCFHHKPKADAALQKALAAADVSVLTSHTPAAVQIEASGTQYCYGFDSPSHHNMLG